MWLVLAAMRRPLTMLVAVIAVGLAAYLAVRRMPVDIFPDIGQPTVYVAQPYGGMDPSQMEGFLTYYYEYHFLYITGIEHVESKSIQGASLMKLAFLPGNRHEPGDGPGGRLRESRPRVHAAGRGAAVHRAVRRRQRSRRPARVLEPDPQPGRDAEHRAESACGRCSPRFPACPRRHPSAAISGRSSCGWIRTRMRAYRISPEDAIAAVNRGDDGDAVGQRPDRGS